MPRLTHTTISPTGHYLTTPSKPTPQQCVQQRTVCLSQNIGNPNPQRAAEIHKCYNNYNTCMKK
jgi:hypothetical protein